MHSENFIYAGTSKGEIYEINLCLNSAKVLVKGLPESELTSLCSEINNSNVVMGYSDGSIYLADGVSKDFSLLHKYSQSVTSLDCLPYPLHALPSDSSAPRRQGVIAVACESGSVELRYLETSFDLIYSSTYENENISRIKSSPFKDGSVSIAIGYHGGGIITISSTKSDLRNWRIVSHCRHLHGAVTHIDWSSDGSMILACSECSAEAIVWSVKNQRLANSSEIACAEWATHSSPFGWQMLGLHEFLSSEKLIGKHVSPTLGLRVKRSNDFLTSLRIEEHHDHISRLQQQVGTIISVSNDERCVVAWDTECSINGICNDVPPSRLKLGAVGSESVQKYDLALAARCFPSSALKEFSCLDWCETYIGEKIVTLCSDAGILFLFRYPCPGIGSNGFFKSHSAHVFGDKIRIKHTSAGRFLFSFSHKYSCGLQWKCVLDSQRTRENLFDVLLTLKNSRASVCLLDCLVALYNFGEQLHNSSTIESLVMWKRYFNAVLEMYDSAVIKTNHETQNISDSSLKQSQSLAVSQDLSNQNVYQRLYKTSSKAPSNTEGRAKAPTQALDSELEGIKLRPLSAGRFYREKSRPESQPQSVVGILRQGVNAARKEYSKQKQGSSRTVSKITQENLTKDLIPEKSLPFRSAIKSNENLLFPEFEKISMFVYSSLTTPNHDENAQRILNRRPRIQLLTYQEAADLFDRILALGSCKLMRRDLFEKILFENPEIAIQIGSKFQLEGKRLLKFDFYMNKTVASEDLVAIIRRCTMSMLQRHSRGQPKKNIVGIDSESEPIIYFEDFLHEFCDGAVSQAYSLLHQSDNFRPLLEDVGSDLNICLMPMQGPEDIQLQIFPDYDNDILFNFGSVPYPNLTSLHVPEFSVSSSDFVSEREVISLLREIGIDPDIRKHLTISDLLFAVQSNPHSIERLEKKQLNVDALVAFITTGSIVAQNQFKWTLDKMVLVPWQQVKQQKLKSRIKLSFRTAKYIFDTLDSNRKGYLTNADFVKGLKLHKNVAELLDLPQYIRQEDGSRERYQDMFMNMDPDGTKKITKKRLFEYFCDIDEANRGSLGVGIDLEVNPNQFPSLPDPDIVFVLSKEEALRAFNFLDFSCSGFLTKTKFQIGLGSYPQLAKRLGMPATFAVRDGSIQFFDLVFGHISQGKEEIHADQFSKYFTTRLQERTTKFFCTGTIRHISLISCMPKLPRKPAIPRYLRDAAVQANIKAEENHPIQTSLPHSNLINHPANLLRLSKLRSRGMGGLHKQTKDYDVAQMSAENARQADKIHAEAKELALLEAIRKATATALELVQISQTQLRVMDPDKEARAAAVLCKLALCCFYQGQISKEDLEQAAEEVCSRIVLAKGAGNWPVHSC